MKKRKLNGVRNDLEPFWEAFGNGDLVEAVLRAQASLVVHYGTDKSAPVFLSSYSSCIFLDRIDMHAKRDLITQTLSVVC